MIELCFTERRRRYYNIVYLDEDQQADPINEDQPNDEHGNVVQMKGGTESNQVIIWVVML